MSRTRRDLRYYIATRFANKGGHCALHRELNSRGHSLTFDWTLLERATTLGADSLAIIAGLEARGVREADVVIGLLPGGRGTHCELGMALALRVPVVLYSEDLTESQLLGPSTADSAGCLFYHHDGVVELVTGRWSETVIRAIADAAERAARIART